jgi:hypothetical protein
VTGLSFSITQRSQNQRIYRLAEEMQRRVDAIEEHYSFDLAKALLPVLQGMAPQDIPGYQENLAVRRLKIRGMAGAAMIGLPAYAHRRWLTKGDAPRTVLYVKPKLAGGKAMDPAAVTLWRSNPWTMDTLPYEPSKRVAQIISRRVSRKDAEKIEAMRAAERPRVEAELRTHGVETFRRNKVLLDQKVTVDLAYEVLRREFGVGDAPHVSHWRPAIRYVKTVLAKQQLKKYLRWLAVPSERRWKRPLVAKTGKVSDIRRVQRFQRFIRA